ncbi:hypothetical protein N5916_11280, partial [Glaesserella parasuis]|nr:hypothetical protein [Glaesserella parasuis]
LKLISDKTKITFQESSEEFLADGTGINFVFSEMKESLLGFASHGGNVHLNALKFSTSSPQKTKEFLPFYTKPCMR